MPFEYGLFKIMIAGGLKFINTRSRLLCMETCWQSSYWYWKKLALLSSVNQLVQQEFTLVFVSSELTWRCWVTVIWSYWKPRKSSHQGIMLARFLQTSGFMRMTFVTYHNHIIFLLGLSHQALKAVALLPNGQMQFESSGVLPDITV